LKREFFTETAGKGKAPRASGFLFVGVDGGYLGVCILMLSWHKPSLNALNERFDVVKARVMLGSAVFA
jgi:hypothetical protein